MYSETISVVVSMSCIVKTSEQYTAYQSRSLSICNLLW